MSGSVATEDNIIIVRIRQYKGKKCLSNLPFYLNARAVSARLSCPEGEDNILAFLNPSPIKS